MNEHLRQTGRTTRLLQKAESLRAMGHAVVMLFPTHEMAQRMKRHLQAAVPVEAVPGDFDWEKMRDPEHPHRVCLPDHSAVEMHLAGIDQEILRLQQLARQLYPLTTNHS